MAKVKGGILMKKIKNMLKKGGVADIVTLMIIVGLVIALIVTVIIPTISDTEMRGSENVTNANAIDSAIKTKVDAGLKEWNKPGAGDEG